MGTDRCRPGFSVSGSERPPVCASGLCAWLLRPRYGKDRTLSAEEDAHRFPRAPAGQQSAGRPDSGGACGVCPEGHGSSPGGGYHYLLWHLQPVRKQKREALTLSGGTAV